MWQKSDETDFLFTKAYIFFKHQCYPLQNSSLGQLHTDGDVVPTFLSCTGSMVFSMSVTVFRMYPKVRKWFTFRIFLSLGKRKMSQGWRSGEQGGWGNMECLLRSKILWQRGQCDMGHCHDGESICLQCLVSREWRFF